MWRRSRSGKKTPPILSVVYNAHHNFFYPTAEARSRFLQVSRVRRYLAFFPRSFVHRRNKKLLAAVFIVRVNAIEGHFVHVFHRQRDKISKMPLMQHSSILLCRHRVYCPLNSCRWQVARLSSLSNLCDLFTTGSLLVLVAICQGQYVLLLQSCYTHPRSYGWNCDMVRPIFR